MATVSVRYIVDDVDAAIAFYTERLGFGVEFNPPVSRSSREASCASCSTSPVPAERANPCPTGAILSQVAGTASNLRLTISAARSRRCATRRRTSATRSSAAEAASRSCLRTPPATPSNFSNPQGTDAASHRCRTGSMRTSENTQKAKFAEFPFHALRWIRARDKGRGCLESQSSGSRSLKRAPSCFGPRFLAEPVEASDFLDPFVPYDST